jgi:protein-L-isoaspartate(D-aspartate) O-methyltransferase
MTVEDSYKHKGMRRNLLRILKNKGIKDKAVLDAMEKVPRHFFFEKAFVEHAYQDKAFPISDGQTISQPFTVAFQTQLLKIRPGMKVLEIGTGSGYQCCILAEMGAKIYTVECIRNLYQQAKENIEILGYQARFHYGDGTEGWPTFKPYDRILVTAGAPYVPKALISQLDNNGILVIPVGGTEHQKMLRVIKDEKGNIIEEDHEYFRFVPLVGKDGWKK